jgi:hypothetical protein
MTWKVFLASATGKHHLDADTPCQDAAHHAQVDDTFIGVVCDGAGSAAQGRQGAEFLARTVTEALAAALRGGCPARDLSSGDGSRLRAIVGAARDALEQLAQAQQGRLRDYASTLVGCIGAPDSGCFFHIGDGFAVHRTEAGASVLSQPENGEYSDETYFVTDTNWQEHLRVTQLPASPCGSLVGLMSDGTSPFAIDRARTGFYGPFIDPVLRYLREAGEPDGNRALHEVLASERTFAITGDDKTLLLALAA